jgi:hypothetical protein
MFGVRLSKMGSASKLGLIAKAIAILRKYGADAHVYLPGIGTVSGLTAGNYLDSAGTTAATVDNPVGLSLDALQAMTLGAELVVNGDNESALFTGASIVNASVARAAAPGGGFAAIGTCSGGNVPHHIVLSLPANKALQVTCRVYVPTGSIATARLFDATDGSWTGGTSAVKDGWATLTGIRAAGKAASWFLGIGDTASANIDGQVFYVDDLSVKEIPGIHATQATTSNKCLLRLTSGKYNWVFDSTDLLTATFPAGNESVTVIDSFLDGQVTTQGVNVVGAYSMGPSVTLYGRMIIKGSISASDLLVLQRFANSWAGL